MSCTHAHCDHKRRMHLSMKHNDLACITVNHLNIDRDDYLPSVGIFGGDYTDFTVCMQCGQIAGWKPISDEEMLKACNIVNEEGDTEDEVAEARRQERNAPVAPIVVVADPKFEETRVTLLNAVITHCGPNWKTDPDVRNFLIEQRDTGATPYVKLAAKRILESM